MLDFLFTTDQDNLHSALDNLTEEKIESLCYENIYHRGTQYYDIGAIKDISYHGGNELVASVHGSRSYDVITQFSDQHVSASCSCPYEDVCKHIVAVLLHALFEKIGGSNIIELNDSSFSSYLKQLSKKELITLVERFAPGEFRTVIQNQFVPEDQSAALVERAVRKVEQVLKDDSLYYEPADMEQALEKQLKKLKGLGDKEAEAIYKLITEIIHRVNHLTEEGWLYNSYYDQPFDDVFVTDFTRSFLKPLSLDKKIKYINGLEPVIKESEYCFFEGVLTDLQELFSEIDLSGLKDILLENVEDKDFKNIEAYYIAAESKLSLDEKVFILSRVHDLSAVLSMQLAKVFEQEGKIKPAIEALESCSEKQDFWSVRETVFNELLRLKNMNNSLDASFADHMLTQLAKRDTLRVLGNYFPDRKPHFEDILRQKAILELLEYFEEEKRLKEALKIVLNYSILEHTKYIFFKKYKNEFSEEAKTYFVRRIEENLINTGNQYYEKIAETLNALMTIDFNKANEIKVMIKQKYKRRTNLMAMLK